MCNAWNHPSSCACGWGGYGHLGRRSSSPSSDIFWWVPPITRTYESYVNPNASCPVCGASVYFYQSPNGGRVFFDELGHPWPKHPCTDNSSAPKAITNHGVTAGPIKVTAYNWQKAGWQPFFIDIISRVDKFTIKIIGKMQGEELTLYAKLVLVRHGQARDISSDCIAQIRKSGADRYELSVITLLGAAATFNVFLSLIQARRDSGRRAIKTLFMSGKTEGNLSKENQSPSIKDVPESSPQSAFAIAYTKAVNKKNESA